LVGLIEQPLPLEQSGKTGDREVSAGWAIFRPSRFFYGAGSLWFAHCGEKKNTHPRQWTPTAFLVQHLSAIAGSFETRLSPKCRE